MSLCDTCREPGACCKGLAINIRFPIEMPPDQVQKHVAEGTPTYEGGPNHQPVPTFVPINRATYLDDGELEPKYCTWRFNCTALDEETGRCNIYRDRPQVCRDFEAGSDPICVHYSGDWKSWLRKMGR